MDTKSSPSAEPQLKLNAKHGFVMLSLHKTSHPQNGNTQSSTDVSQAETFLKKYRFVFGIESSATTSGGITPLPVSNIMALTIAMVTSTATFKMPAAYLPAHWTNGTNLLWTRNDVFDHDAPRSRYRERDCIAIAMRLEILFTDLFVSEETIT